MLAYCVLQHVLTPLEPGRYDLALNHESSRSRGGGQHRPFQVRVLVTTHPGHTEKQNLIRRTWAGNQYLQRCTNGSITVNFVVGKVNETEGGKAAELTDDVLHVNVTESYWNLGKKVQQMLIWAHRNLPDADLIIKTDDDVFLNIPVLCRRIGPGARPVPLYGGTYCHKTSNVIRGDNRWAATKEEFPEDKYPPYCIGLLYWLRRDALARIQPYLTSAPVFKFEDAYMGMALRAANITDIRLFESDRITQDEDYAMGHNLGFHKPGGGNEIERLFNKSLSLFP